MPVIERLTSAQLASESFLALLREAVEVPRDALLVIRDDELAVLEVAGVVDDDVVAFAAWNAESNPQVLEYIAVDSAHRGLGLGSALIARIRASGPLLAETDDDAVDFYRRLGFTVTPIERDERWPDRQRYRCLI